MTQFACLALVVCVIKDTMFRGSSIFRANRNHLVYMPPTKAERANENGPWCARCGGTRVGSIDMTHDGSKRFEVLVKCHGEERAWSYEYPLGRSEPERLACLTKVNHMIFFEPNRENALENSSWIKGTG